MVGSICCGAVLAFGVVMGPPDLPPDRDGTASIETTSAEPSPTEPDPAPVEPVVTPQPEPEPIPEPEPVVAVEPTSTVAVVAAVDDEVAPRVRQRRPDEDDEGPVERFEPGQWGMQFVFGGLAPMSFGGLRDFGVNRLTFTEIGFRRVLNNNWMVPFSVGAGIFAHSPSEGSSQNDVGLATSVGVQRYFRVWRRIAPFAGGRFGLHYTEPNGRANWMVGVRLGPVLGIEYFVGHRVSLSLQGNALLGVGIFSGLLQIEVATQLDAGGQTGLTFYF